MSTAPQAATATPAEIALFRSLLLTRMGLHLGPDRQAFLINRIQRGMQTAGARSFYDYYRKLVQPGPGQGFGVVEVHRIIGQAQAHQGVPGGAVARPAQRAAQDGGDILQAIRRPVAQRVTVGVAFKLAVFGQRQRLDGQAGVFAAFRRDDAYFFATVTIAHFRAEDFLDDNALPVVQRHRRGDDAVRSDVVDLPFFQGTGEQIERMSVAED